MSAPGSWRLVAAVALITAACGSAAVPTTVATVPVPATSATTTSTTTPAPTTTEPATTTSIPSVAGVPPEAFALVGAPMPEVDLTFPDGFDGEAWFEAYADWNRWAFANPDEGLESLDDWVLPGSEQHEALGEQLQDSCLHGWRTVRVDEISVVDWEAADELLDAGLIVLNLLTQVSGEAWILDGEGGVVAYELFDESRQRRSQLEIRRDGGGRWKLGAWR